MEIQKLKDKLAIAKDRVLSEGSKNETASLILEDFPKVLSLLESYMREEELRILHRAVERNDEIVLDSFTDPVWKWFELTYSEYLTVPRLVLQSMSKRWQFKLIDLLEEMDDTFDWRPKGGRYWVQLRDEKGRLQKDPLGDYRRGTIEKKKNITEEV